MRANQRKASQRLFQHLRVVQGDGGDHDYGDAGKDGEEGGGGRGNPLGGDPYEDGASSETDGCYEGQD